jgi:uncharacterized protein
MTMASSNEDLVRRGYEAFAAGDMASLMALMADDVVHVIPGDSPLAGEHKGPDELTTLYGQLFSLSGGTYRAELVSIEERGPDQVVSRHRGTAQREGRTLDTEETLTFTIEDGKVTRIESSFSPQDEAIEDAFWS